MDSQAHTKTKTFSLGLVWVLVTLIQFIVQMIWNTFGYTAYTHLTVTVHLIADFGNFLSLLLEACLYHNQK